MVEASCFLGPFLLNDVDQVQVLRSDFRRTPPLLTHASFSGKLVDSSGVFTPPPGLRMPDLLLREAIHNAAVGAQLFNGDTALVLSVVGGQVDEQRLVSARGYRFGPNSMRFRIAPKPREIIHAVRDLPSLAGRRVSVSSCTFVPVKQVN